MTSPPFPPLPEDTVRERKRALRARALAARAALEPAARAAEAQDATARLLALPAWSAARTVAAYLSIDAEFDTGPLVREILGSGRRLVLPRVVDPRSPAARRLVLHAVADPRTDTLAGPWEIREPDPRRCPEVAVDTVDLLLMPGLAFDRQGGRLGYGAGYYDRLIAATGPGCVRVALAFGVQCVPEVPMQSHDQRIDWLVTAEGAWQTGGK
jgi:5,10-methenyltetrahydrofolate synthetase